MINGLFYLPNFISKEEELDLLAKIDNQEWSADLKRRVQHYGYKYDYTKKSINSSMKIGEIPDFLSIYVELIKPLFDKVPDQVIVNEYLPGQGISKHIDCVPCFGPVVASLSLGTSTVMNFNYKYSDDKKEEINLLPRSLLLLEDDARYNWSHGIARQKDNRRISITFRTVII